MFKFLSKLISPSDPSLRLEVQLSEFFKSLGSNVSLEIWGMNRARGYSRAESKIIGYFPGDFYRLLENINAKTRIHNFEEGCLAARVFVNSTEEMFIPMIDFDTRPSEYELNIFFNRLVQEVPSLTNSKLLIFDSTNSYHGYITNLISPTEWDNFLHFLSGAPFVDQTWVKFSHHCLRWTKGSGRRHEPEFVFEIKRESK